MALYVGLMSGTSADGIDAVLTEIVEGKVVQLLGHYFLPMPTLIRNKITSLYEPDTNEIDRLGELDVELGHLFANATLRLLKDCKLGPERIAAVGSHGQTVRHRPRNRTPFTLQIGDPNTIANRTGINTVADFRRRDMTLGGQGAPLAPIFHRAAFAAQGQRRGVLNIGGIANLTILPGDDNVLGYDLGPGNGLMDYWCQKCRQMPFDRNGEWARSGTVNLPLLNQLQQHAFFQLQPPRSTGREEFSGAWLESQLMTNPSPAAEDIQATLMALTSWSIAEEVKKSHLAELFLCGGGVHNHALIESIKGLLPGIPISPTDVLGVPAEHVESTTFAWLAQQTMNKLAGNHPSVTGASKFSVLGGVYFA